MKAIVAKFSYGERHAPEYLTRIVLLNGHAFLFGDTMLGCRDQILCGAHDANDRKDTERNGQISVAIILLKAQGRAKHMHNSFGHIVLLATTAAVALALLFEDLGPEQNGINHLYDCRGNIFLSAIGIGTRAESIARTALVNT
jgi:hypothetical protein